MELAGSIVQPFFILSDFFLVVFVSNGEINVTVSRYNCEFVSFSFFSFLLCIFWSTKFGKFVVIILSDIFSLSISFSSSGTLMAHVL